MSQLAPRNGSGEIAYGPSTTSFEWKIKDYFTISQEIDHRLDSPSIEFLDATWCIRLYPNGRSIPQSAGWIGLYLVKKKSVTPMHCVNLTIELKKYDDSNVMSATDVFEFGKRFSSCGWPTFFQVSVLNQERYTIARDGTLILFCSMSANRSKGVHAVVQTDTSSAAEKLVQDFKNLMLNEEASDVILNVKNRKFRVHSAVLVARSSVFAAMMKHEMKEKSSGSVEINDCDPDAFQVYLEYLYSGDVQQISPDTVFELHSIVDKYDAGELKAKCIKFMMDSLSIDTVCDVLALSLRHNECELLDRAVMFFGRNLKDILVTIKWQSFFKENPMQANDLYLRALDYYEKPD